MNLVSENIYAKDVDYARKFLQGKSDQVISHLVGEMEKSSEKDSFMRKFLGFILEAMVFAVHEKNWFLLPAYEVFFLRRYIPGDYPKKFLAYYEDLLSAERDSFASEGKRISDDVNYSNLDDFRVILAKFVTKFLFYNFILYSKKVKGVNFLNYE